MKVQYDATGFLEKNCDYLPPEITALLKKSEISLIRTLFCSHLAKTGLKILLKKLQLLRSWFIKFISKGNLIYGSLKTNNSSCDSFDKTISNVKYARSTYSSNKVNFFLRFFLKLVFN